MIRLSGIAAMAGLSMCLLNQTTTPIQCAPQKPDHTPEYVAVGVVAGIAVGTVVLVEVHKDHHRIKGCVSAGPNGLELQDASDMKMYALSGATMDVKVGALVKLHGTKERQAKGSTGERTFAVEKVSRNFGSCKVIPKTTASADEGAGKPQSQGGEEAAGNAANR